MKINLLTEAEMDIQQGIVFYENQQQGLGGYFYNSILSDISSLRIYCGIHFKVKGFYRMLAKRFPYAIYYKYNHNVVSIYAVLDCRQDPQGTRYIAERHLH